MIKFIKSSKSLITCKVCVNRPTTEYYFNNTDRFEISEAFTNRLSLLFLISFPPFVNVDMTTNNDRILQPSPYANHRTAIELRLSSTGKVGRHLLLIAIRTDRWQVDCCNIGGEEPEEDGRWWIVR